MCENPGIGYSSTGERFEVDLRDVLGEVELPSVSAKDPMTAGKVLYDSGWGPLPTTGSFIDEGQPD